MFLLDAAGTLVFFNEAAELLIGARSRRSARSRASSSASCSSCASSTARRAPARLARRRRVLRAAARAQARARAPCFDGVTRQRRRGDGVPAVRRGRRDARRRHRLLAAEQPRRRAGVRATVWGCRGIAGDAGRRHRPLRRQHVAASRCALDSGHRLVLDAGTGMRPLGVHDRTVTIDELHILLDAPASRPPAGPRLLPPAVRSRTRGAPLGSGVAGAEPRRAHRDLPLAAAVPGAPRRHPGAPHRSTTSRRSITIGSATVHAANVTHQGPTVGYRIEEHGRVLAYLPDHEPSLGVRSRAATGRLDQRPRGRARRRRPVPRRGSTATTSIRRTSAGATRASTTSSSSRASSTSIRSCCSTTIRTTPTTSSKRCSTPRSSAGRRPATTSASPTKA